MKELDVKINAKVLSQVDAKCSLQTKQVYLANSFSTSDLFMGSTIINKKKEKHTDKTNIQRQNKIKKRDF